MNDTNPTRREQLLADGVLAWLEDGDRPAFEALVRDPAAQVEFAQFERAAMVATVATAASLVALEQQRLLRLVTRLEADALEFFGLRRRGPVAEPSRGRRVLPWLVAAASLAIALLVWRIPAAAPEPAVGRLALLRGGGALTCAWQPGPSPFRGEVSGDVVWDAAGQEGYLRLKGLPPLRSEQRYQLWIVDADRTGPPVDGGLLAIPGASEEAVVHVAPRLPIGRAAAFVLTVERAEGVVVSAQEHVVAIARP